MAEPASPDADIPNPDPDESKNSGTFECNICFDIAKDPVVTLCGHLFCWPCLHQWIETRPNRKMCPVCKAGISADKVVPLYGRGTTDPKDPRTTVPPRPQGQRTEPETSSNWNGFGTGDAFQMSFGIGAFPFAFFSSNLSFGDQRPPRPPEGTPQHRQEQLQSKLFLIVACLLLAWLVFA